MTDDAPVPARNKGGRPRKEPAKGKRGNYSFRMTDFTRDQLGGRASEAGRSLSEEIEYRVEQSLQKDRRLHAILTMLGGADMVIFATMMNGDLRIAIQEAENKVGGTMEWYESPEKLAIVCAHMREVVGRTTEAFARMTQTGVAARIGQQNAKLAE